MNKLAAVTGASKGIGRAIAEKFASKGFHLAVTARNANDLELLKKRIESKYNVNCHIFPSDLSVKKEVIKFTEYVSSLENEVNVLVNNTGTFIQGDLMNESDGTLEAQMNTNLYSAYYTTRGLIGSIRKSKGSHIFNICSIASLQAYPNSGSYTISKFALLGFSKSLRAELLPERIKVTSVLPGATYTSSWKGVDLPESRFMKAQDVADAVWAAYSLSPSAVMEEIILRPLEGDI